MARPLFQGIYSSLKDRRFICRDSKCSKTLIVLSAICASFAELHLFLWSGCLQSCFMPRPVLYENWLGCGWASWIAFVADLQFVSNSSRTLLSNSDCACPLHQERRWYWEISGLQQIEFAVFFLDYTHCPKIVTVADTHSAHCSWSNQAPSFKASLHIAYSSSTESEGQKRGGEDRYDRGHCWGSMRENEIDFFRAFTEDQNQSNATRH